MPLLLSRKQSRLLTCFYCNVQSGKTSSRTGRIEAWTCPLCEALNVLDPQGQIADTIPEKFQQAEEPSHAQRLKQAPDLQSPFCATCSGNQALLIKTLASYLPDPSDKDYALYESALPAYRASLEERFPLFCASCAPTLQARLERNNYVAKSLALGTWLNGQPSSVRISRLSRMLWFLRGCLFWAMHVASFVWFLSEAVKRPTAWMPSWSFLVTCFALGSFWNPLGLTQQRFPQRKLQGKAEYLQLQGFMLLIRMAALVVLPRLSHGAPLRLRLAILGVVLALLHAWLSTRLLVMEHPVSARLGETSSKLGDLVQGEIEVCSTQTQASPFQFQVRPRSASHKRSAAAIQLDGLDEDSMDWQASPTATQASPFATFAPASQASTVFGASAFTQRPALNDLSRMQSRDAQSGLPPLAPQRLFAPERPTGLESLFHAAVRLDDEPLLVRSLRRGHREPAVLTSVLQVSFLVACLLGSVCLYLRHYGLCLALYTLGGFGLLYQGLRLHRVPSKELKKEEPGVRVRRHGLISR